ncbi:acyl-CoA dehydrogenase [Paracoccus yeei]|uniref:Acyl-CoA dehydrogenase n=1 Tax=Paracoccus yeei TaxID=147645 RepID=A0A386UP21_9RHOB|nr:acyl-CoA dehydrogenase family protein [Paracoccus yeei]AYF01562.1 acyl-CoA dehydrogenase [Paracoccus yeei]
MNKPMNHSYWGKTVDYRDMLNQIAQIGPQLEANAPADDTAGELTPETFALLKPLRFSHLLATEELGGAQMRPTEVLQLLEAVSYHSGSAGWVSMVHCCIGAMSAAFLPDSAVERLFAPGTDNRFSGQGAPLGMLKKVEGGYALTGKWSYGSGFSHATWSHSACFVDDGTGKPAKDEAGNVIVMCAHAPIPEHKQLGNWDVLGLKGTGSIDYSAEDVFIAKDLVFPILTAPPQRLKELFSLGIVGLAAIGHTGWALGTGRRMLDEIAGFARSKSGRAGLIGESEKFWYDYGRAEAAYRAARAFAMEVWSEIEHLAENGQMMTTRQISLVHLAKAQAHEVGVDVCNFAYRASGGAGLRAGVIQRTFRDMMVAANHFTVAPSLVTSAGRDLGGQWSDRVWQFYDLIEKK